MNKQNIITQVILLAILAVIVTFLVVSYETSEEKAQLKGLEDKVKSLETQLEKSNIKFESLREVADEVTKRYNETSEQEREIQLLKDKVKFLEGMK